MAHLDALAKGPRAAGSAAAASARQYCAEQLEVLGFTLTELPFEYSALPGRYGAPIIGGVGAMAVIVSLLLTDRGQPISQAAVVITIGLTAFLAWRLGNARSTQLATLRETAINLEAVRGPRPSVYLVAHIDSKSQRVSTAVRTLGVLSLVVALIGFAFASLLPAGPGPVLSSGIAVFAAVAGRILTQAVVGNRSDGAADNASGVASVLAAAALIAPEKSFGILITDAEELALAGARAWVVGRSPGIAINCDTVDDDGRLVVMRYGPPADLSRRAIAAARAEDPAAKAIRPLPGVLTDSVAFRSAGWQTVTLSRGTLRTLNRIHTVRDNLQYLRGTGIPAAARVLARLVEELA